VNPARRNEYLRAMGIQAWIPRAAGVPAPDTGVPVATAVEIESSAQDPVKTAIANAIVLGPGAGDTLLFCGHSAEAATPLAADIVRCLACEPVWSWPADDSVPGIPLEQAINERLFTRVLVFGQGLAAVSSGVVIGSARVIRVESIPVLAESAAARRNLWLALVEQ
jgi:hypothetical protein